MFRFLCFAVLVVSTQVRALEDMSARNPLCKSRNAFYSMQGNCDSYIECRDYIAKEMQCPDGLHYDPSAMWPSYPCGYPMDISCQGRGSPQPSQGNADCPHQYGFFPSPLATPDDCGLYRMCVEGKPVEMACPPGLAFNPPTGRCDWPDVVPTCNVDAFLGFRCPPAPLDESGVPLVVNYRFEGNCFAFFSCDQGHARLLMCDAGYAFDPSTGRCEDAERVKC